LYQSPREAPKERSRRLHQQPSRGGCAHPRDTAQAIRGTRGGYWRVPLVRQGPVRLLLAAGPRGRAGISCISAGVHEVDHRIFLQWFVATIWGAPGRAPHIREEFIEWTSWTHQQERRPRLKRKIQKPRIPLFKGEGPLPARQLSPEQMIFVVRTPCRGRYFAIGCSTATRWGAKSC
jgi:hypothetical protein